MKEAAGAQHSILCIAMMKGKCIRFFTLRVLSAGVVDVLEPKKVAEERRYLVFMYIIRCRSRCRAFCSATPYIIWKPQFAVAPSSAIATIFTSARLMRRYSSLAPDKDKTMLSSSVIIFFVF